MSAVFENVYKLPQQEECRVINNVNKSKGLLATLRHWKSISHQRKQLAKLDDRMLDDIGLTKDQVEKEVVKPFWR